jgi:hypothetical protein
MKGNGGTMPTVLRPNTDNPEAPFGRDGDGNPLAPHGWLNEGKDDQRPRMYRLIDKSSADLAMDLLAKPLALPEALVAKAAPVPARSERAEMIDEVVRKSYAKWDRAGRPTTWESMAAKKLVGGYWVEPSAIDGLKSLLEASAAFVSANGSPERVRVFWGSPVDRDETMEKDGRVFIPFVTIARVPKKKTEAAS